MRFSESSLKIVHFEYNADRSEDEITENNCKVAFGAKKNSETDKNTVFYFRWIVKFSSINGIILDIIGEDSYDIDDPSLITAEEMLLLMKKSLSDFRIKIYAKLKRVLVFDIPIDESQAATFLIKLCHEQ